MVVVDCNHITTTHTATTTHILWSFELKNCIEPIDPLGWQ